MHASPKRITFLADLLTAAIENYGYGWFSVDSYPDVPEAELFAVIRDEDDEVYRVDLAAMARGLRVIRESTLADLDGDGDPVYVTASGEQLHFGGKARAALLLADRTNGDDGDYDVIGALAVLECALFGHVVYG